MAFRVFNSKPERLLLFIAEAYGAGQYARERYVSYAVGTILPFDVSFCSSIPVPIWIGDRVRHVVPVGSEGNFCITYAQ